jgi:hypothetical protein
MPNCEFSSTMLSSGSFTVTRYRERLAPGRPTGDGSPSPTAHLRLIRSPLFGKQRNRKIV